MRGSIPRVASVMLKRIKLINEYRISTDKSELAIETIHSFLANSYWSFGIPKEVVIKSIDNSLCFGIFTSANEQIGFARIISDYATFAYLADVFILESHRGKGLSKWLLQTIIKHPDLQGLRRIILATKDAHTLYEKFGFTKLGQAEIFMENLNSDVYKKKY